MLARVLGHSATLEQVLPELTELLADDEVQVGGLFGCDTVVLGSVTM